MRIATPSKDRENTQTPQAELKLAATIVDVARELARTLPPPRGTPFFFLDSDASYDPQVLDALCERGALGKQDLALDIGSGLGGRARWLAVRAGCRVVGVDPQLPMVAAAAMLNRRARMEDQVRFQVGRAECLPWRDRVFTRVWLVDVSYDTALADTYAEALRVLRPGGHLAMQCPLSSYVRPDALLDALRGVGFVDVEAYEGIFSDLPQACRSARDRLRVALQFKLHEAAVWERLEKREHGHVRLVVYARRPA